MSNQGTTGWAASVQSVMNRFRRGPSNTRQMSLVESIAIGQRGHVCLVRVGTEQFLVGSGPSGVTCVSHVRDNSAEPAA